MSDYANAQPSDGSDRSALPEILGEQYQIKKQLASKGGRKTLLARNLSTQELVVIKLLSFGDDFTWEDLKLFEREAETLKSLHHASIPKYLDYFEINSDRTRGFALVQSYIDAPSLEEQLKTGRTFSEEEVKQLAKAILEILDYLHSLQPPVIHRDIKPSNILLSNRSGHSVGDVYLVDFGSVQNLAMKQTSTMTIVGTYGYMPPEQFSGKANPASDLYGLGATLIHLVTGQHPAELPQTDLKIEFESATNVSNDLKKWLVKMTNPLVSKRFSSAKTAIQALDEPNNEIDSSTLDRLVKPYRSKIILNKNDDSIEIIFAPSGIFSPSALTFLGITLFASINLFSPLSLSLETIVIASCPAIVYLSYLLTFLFGKKRLYIDRNEMIITRRSFSFVSWQCISISRRDIAGLEIVPHNLQYAPHLSLAIWTQEKFSIRKQYDLFDGYFPLTEREVEWLAQELSEWLDLPVVK
jgi:serine/threonine protein kinase